MVNRFLSLFVFALVFNMATTFAQSIHSSKEVFEDKKLISFPLKFPIENSMTGYLGMRYQYNMVNRILKIDEQELLGGYLQRPGKQRWIGEHVGKYLETAANIYLITGNTQVKEQMDRIAKTLVSTQLPDGYLGTYLPGDHWTAWDVWVHKYNIYGLLAYYKATGNEFAFTSVKKMADLLIATFGNNPGQKDIIKSGSHVGMAATSIIDPMVDLYMLTGDKRYIDFCNYVIGAYENPGGPSIVKTLLKEKRVDKVANGKAYEMLSNLLGLVKLYRVTKNEDLLTVSKYAFEDIATNRLYITGTSSDHERFKEDFDLRADTTAHMGEGCVTTTWIQFNMQLFSITGDLKYYNEIEKSVYNQLLGAENPETGCVSYYTPLMGVKPYRCNITCCLSSVPRGIALIPYINYGKLNKMPTVLLYESTTIKDSITTNNNSRLPIELKIASLFPEKGSATIHVKVPQAAIFALQLRVPIWATDFTASVNGKTYKGKTNELLKIERRWNKEDKISVSFNIPVSILDGGKSYPGYFAFKRGPQVLSVDNSLNTSYNIETESFLYPKKPAVILSAVKQTLPTGWIGKQAYSISLVTNGGKTKPIVFVPYAEASQTGGESNVWIPTTKGHFAPQ